MKKTFLLVMLATVLPLHAQNSVKSEGSDAYMKELLSLIEQRDQSVSNAKEQAEEVKLNPYFFRLMTPGTYYSRPVQSMMVSVMSFLFPKPQHRIGLLLSRM